MNLINRAISVFSPTTALKREFAQMQLNTYFNSGYDQSGASKIKNH